MAERVALRVLGDGPTEVLADAPEDGTGIPVAELTDRDALDQDESPSGRQLCGGAGPLTGKPGERKVVCNIGHAHLRVTTSRSEPWT
ncbi:hypothetical protein ACIA98_16720 [Streptomyces sp. NPDC051366]|uniref:hypothetical protein n=1 Tax=Streptomyces sp. NPDC051366 TaxID=3365652 RepID=UPI0037A198A7